MLVTNKHLFTLDFGPYNYNVHRKVQIRLIDAVTTSKKAGINEMVLHFMGDYDERYECGDHRRNVVCLIVKLLKTFGNTIKRYEVPDKKLRKYNTTKKEANKGKFIRPDEKWLVPDDEKPQFKFD